MVLDWNTAFSAYVLQSCFDAAMALVVTAALIRAATEIRIMRLSLVMGVSILFTHPRARLVPFFSVDGWRVPQPA